MVELTNKMIADNLINNGRKQNILFVVSSIIQLIIVISMLLVMYEFTLFRILGYTMVFSTAMMVVMGYKAYKSVAQDLKDGKLKVVENLCKGKEHDGFTFYLRLDNCEEKIMVPEELYKETSLGDSIYLVYIGDRPDVLNIYSGNNYKYVG